MEIQTTRPQPGRRIREGFRGQRLTVLPKTVVRQGQGLPVVGELFVTDIGHYPSAPGHYVDRPHGRGESILIYCTSGSGWCEMGGKEWRAQEGWALFIPPETPHVYGADAEDPWAIWWVHFGGPLSAEFLRALAVTRDKPLLYAPETLLLAEAFEETYAHLQDGYIDNSLLGLSTGLTRVLGLLKTHQRAPHARRRRGEENIYRSIRYMREHIDRPQRLSELAELLGLTVPHYSTLFRKVTGTSPGRFLTRLKMQRACELLDTTDAPVGEVARRIGFRDPFHFSRVFKHVVGKAPTIYRDIVKG